jgi:hypothetical protein
MIGVKNDSIGLFWMASALSVSGRGIRIVCGGQKKVKKSDTYLG